MERAETRRMEGLREIVWWRVGEKGGAEEEGGVGGRCLGRGGGVGEEAAVREGGSTKVSVHPCRQLAVDMAPAALLLCAGLQKNLSHQPRRQTTGSKSAILAHINVAAHQHA